MIEIGIAFTFRSLRKLVFTRSPFVNKYLFMASVVSIVATIIIVYWAPARSVFETVPISLNSWVIAVLTALILVVIFDIGKVINKKTNFLPIH
jgi:Ca2+-transporting ATPase